MKSYRFSDAPALHQHVSLAHVQLTQRRVQPKFVFNQAELRGIQMSEK